MHKSWYLVVAAVALALLAISPLAAQQTVDFYLNGVGSGDNLGGVYTSPYSGGLTSTAISSVICDDFTDESFVPEAWTAYATSMSSILNGSDNPSDLYFVKTGNISVDGYSLDQAQAYSVAGILAVEILQESAPTQTQAQIQAQEDLSYAMWALFTPSALSAIGSPDAGNAMTYLDNAVAELEVNNVNGTTVSQYLNNYNVTVYSYNAALNPSGPSCGGVVGGCSWQTPQEFITVPEASTPVLLAIDLLGFMALVGFLRKRMTRSV
jgi:hypothetical protein